MPPESQEESPVYGNKLPLDSRDMAKKGILRWARDRRELEQDAVTRSQELRDAHPSQSDPLESEPEPSAADDFPVGFEASQFKSPVLPSASTQQPRNSAVAPFPSRPVPRLGLTRSNVERHDGLTGFRKAAA